MTSRDLATSRWLFFPPTSPPPSWTEDLPTVVERHEGAVALPLGLVPGSRQLAGAVYDRHGELVRASQRAKSNRAWAPNPARQPIPAADVVHVPGRTYFGGHLRPAFGHVLLEVLPRFWPAAPDRTADHVLLYPTRPTARDHVRLPGFAVDLLRAAGVEAAQVVVSAGSPLRFEELVVPTPAFWLKRGFSPRVAEVFQRVGSALADRVDEVGTTAASPADRRRTYLSRSRLGAGSRRATNEQAIERVVASAGFDVLHPQEMSVAEQVVAIRGSAVVAGCDGSALHLAAFARPGTMLLALDSRVVPNQLMIDRFAGLEAVHALVVDGADAGRSHLWSADLARVETAVETALAITRG